MNRIPYSVTRQSINNQQDNFLEKLTVAQQIKKLAAFYGKQKGHSYVYKGVPRAPVLI
jgi:hypothetical protein